MRSLLSLLVLGLTAATQAATRPNVLFIAVDDLRPELGCYGRSHIHSPNIDRLAARGVVFTRAYCQQAVCSPSRTSLMTGLRPDTTKVWDLFTHFRAALPDTVTLGQHFKNHGYFVQGMGKIYHGNLDDPATWSVPWQTPEAPVYGLERNNLLNQRQFAGRTAGSEAAPPRAAAKETAETSVGPRASPRNSRGPAFEAAEVPDDTFQDGKVAALAMAALRELSARPESFFLAVGFSRPHLPFVAPKRYWDLYDPARLDLAPNPYRPRDAPAYAVLPGSELRAYDAIPAGSIPADLARQLVHGYYAAVSYTDAQVGRLLDELDRLGLRDNTIVVLWGDHGWKLGEHDAWCKHSTTENDTNSPLIVSAPGLPAAGQTSPALVELVDVYPTLAELAGLPAPARTEGLSFAPLLTRPDLPWKSAAFSQFPRTPGQTGKEALMGYAMRTAHHRLTVWVPRDHDRIEAIELYDLAADPQEDTNIAARPENAALVERLLVQWRAGWQGALPPSVSRSGF